MDSSLALSFLVKLRFLDSKIFENACDPTIRYKLYVTVHGKTSVKSQN